VSTLKTNAIQTTAGKPILNSTGSVLQVVQSVKTDTFSSTGFTYRVVTGLEASITPSSTGSKILILIDAKIGSYPDYGALQQITKNGSGIYLGDTNGSRPRVSNWTTYYDGSGTFGYTLSSQIICYLDSPATTAETTYGLALASYSTNTAYVNRSHLWQNTSQYDGAPASSITLMEISG
jgi:hypothetical protein